jgi:hypothetical protein
LQGSNIFDGILKTMIKEDHFACTTRMSELANLKFEISNLKSTFNLSGPRCTPTLPNPHPRGCPTIHLSKNKNANNITNHCGKKTCRNNVRPRKAW